MVDYETYLKPTKVGTYQVKHINLARDIVLAIQDKDDPMMQYLEAIITKLKLWRRLRTERVALLFRSHSFD